MSLLQKARTLFKLKPRLLRSEEDQTEGTGNSVGNNNSGQTISNLNNINDENNISNDKNIDSNNNSTDLTRIIGAVFKCFHLAGLKRTKETCHSRVRQVEFLSLTFSPE